MTTYGNSSFIYQLLKIIIKKFKIIFHKILYWYVKLIHQKYIMLFCTLIWREGVPYLTWLGVYFKIQFDGLIAEQTEVVCPKLLK